MFKQIFVKRKPGARRRDCEKCMNIYIVVIKNNAFVNVELRHIFYLLHENTFTIPLTTKNGIDVYNIGSTLKDDQLSTLFEYGQQKRGTRLCRYWFIGINCAKSISHSFKPKTITLSDHIIKIHSSVPSGDGLWHNDTIKLYNKLDSPDLIAEH